MTMRGDPANELPLHPLEFRILLVLAEGPSHGYEIVRAIEEREQYGPIYPANLYRRIRDLLARGLIEEVTLTARTAEDARRRYLDVTPWGRRVARAEAVRLDSLVREARAGKLLPSARGRS
jgi:DNA-binding PadR family transcriptional regulator